MWKEIKKDGLEKWQEKQSAIYKAEQEWKEARKKERERAEYEEKLTKYNTEHCIYCGSRISSNHNCAQCGAPAGN